MRDPAQTKKSAMKDVSNDSSIDLTLPPISDPETLALYDEFQNQVRAQRVDVGSRIESALSQGETLADQLAALDTLKTWLDSFRPLPAAVLEELQKFYRVSLTYNSNAIEGNTLTQQAHFRFVSIHPFRDGNGRTARLLMNLCLLRAGLSHHCDHQCAPGAVHRGLSDWAKPE
jgi:hypothetical protein